MLRGPHRTVQALRIRPFRRLFSVLAVSSVGDWLGLLGSAVFASSQDLATPGWAYALYIAPLWAIGFWMLIRPGPIRLAAASFS